MKIADYKLRAFYARKAKERERARIVRVVGFLSAELPELHQVEAHRLTEATDKAIAAVEVLP